jgi:hypothetical protein
MQTVATTRATETQQLPTLYSRKDAAWILKISIRKLDLLIAGGRLAAVRIDGRVLLSGLELMDFIEKHTTRKVGAQVQ